MSTVGARELVTIRARRNGSVPRLGGWQVRRPIVEVDITRVLVATPNDRRTAYLPIGEAIGARVEKREQRICCWTGFPLGFGGTGIAVGFRVAVSPVTGPVRGFRIVEFVSLDASLIHGTVTREARERGTTETAIPGGTHRSTKVRA